MVKCDVSPAAAAAAAMGSFLSAGCEPFESIGDRRF